MFYTHTYKYPKSFLSKSFFIFFFKFLNEKFEKILKVFIFLKLKFYKKNKKSGCDQNRLISVFKIFIC